MAAGGKDLAGRIDRLIARAEEIDALEAAATGRAYDGRSTEPVEHIPERVELTERLVGALR